MALTLIVEDGTGLANANSFITLEEFDAYYEIYGNAGSDPTAWADEFKTQMVIRAAYAMLSCDWLGVPATLTQALSFPRRNLRTKEGVLVDETTVPVFAKYGQAAWAGALGQSVVEANTEDIRGITSLSIAGMVSLTLDGTQRSSDDIPNAALLWIGPYCIPPSTGGFQSIRTVRA